jgi:hypothetical protein
MPIALAGAFQISQSSNEAAAIGAAVSSALGAYPSLGGFVPLGLEGRGLGARRSQQVIWIELEL